MGRLILSRKPGETIVLVDRETGEEVARITNANGHRTRMGVVADDRIIILREEVQDRIRTEGAKRDNLRL